MDIYQLSRYLGTGVRVYVYYICGFSEIQRNKYVKYLSYFSTRKVGTYETMRVCRKRPNEWLTLILNTNPAMQDQMVTRETQYGS